MSVTETELRPVLRRKVRAVTWQLWSLHVGRGLARTAVVASVLLAATAAADYFFELPWSLRAGLLAACAAAVAVLAVRWVVRPARAWNRARVAVALEGLFPRLGQRLRTATQHGGRSTEELVRDGVSPPLVAALEEETAEKVKPLPFQAALPVRPTLVAAAAGLCCVALLAGSAVRESEWRTALGRMLLGSTPYTSLSASSAADVVDEGADVEVRATMAGRARQPVVLNVREAGDTDWNQETMDAGEGGYTARLANLRTNTEFFVTAGPERTPVQQVAVRRPLKFVKTHIEVTSPAYTGLAPATHDTGSFSAVEGSKARIQFEFDRAPAAAALVLRDPAKPTAPARRVEMAVEGQSVSAELPLKADVEYTVEARDAAGVPAVANRNRVRVTADQPPTVWFDTPAESMEVHTLAEILMRAHARDDFGLTKVGIVFQVNNEEERTLVLEDVNQPNQHEARAEQVLMLEQFLLTQKDCVAYYAYAEDNRPGTPQRTTTELRFIDIRPFLRTYQLVDMPDAPPGQQKDLIFLDEVIARQRFNLNQTMRLETHAQARIDLAQVEKVSAFENKLATQTHDLADFLASLGVDGAAILQQAEESMLSAVDSLNGAKFSTAVGQERDALRFLMEARDTARLALQKKPKPVRAQARAFDRLQRQKLRRKNEKADTLPEIAEELAKLADEEDEVARTLASNPGDNPTDAQTAGDGKPGDTKPDAKPDAKPNPDGSDKPGADKPMDKKPGSDKPDPDKPMGKGSGPDKPDPDKPADKGPGADKPDPDKPMDKGAGPDQKVAGKDGKGGEDPAQERQDDVAARATALDKVAPTTKGLTGLARKRIADAAKAANGGADALGQRDRAGARKEVDRAREQFRLAAKQVAALAAEEAAQQIAAARDIANDVALQTAPGDPMQNSGAGGKADEKKPDAKTPGAGSNDKDEKKPDAKMPGAGDKGEDAKKSDPKMPGAGNKGEDEKKPGLENAAEQAKTLKDVMEQIAGSGSEGAADAARKVAGLLKKEDLNAAIERLEKPGVGDDRGERQDLSARFAALGQKLDQAYRETIAPRLEELARLEREASDLEKRAGAAEDGADWRRLRQQGSEFIEHLEAADLEGFVNEDLRAGLRAGSALEGRELFGRGVGTVRARLMAKLQEFVAGDRFASGNEAVPPEYKDLVDRYLRALAAGSTK